MDEEGDRAALNREAGDSSSFLFQMASGEEGESGESDPAMDDR